MGHNGAERAREREIFDQISASLAEQYDTLYYVNIEDGTYSEISSTDEYKRLNVPATGKDFFCRKQKKHPKIRPSGGSGDGPRASL